MPRDCSARSKEKWMRDALERRRDEGTLRELRTAEGDHCFIDFTSNDYLGLGRSKELRMEIEKEEVKAWEETAIQRQQQKQLQSSNSLVAEGASSALDVDDTNTSGGFAMVGSGGSRLLSGNTWYAEALEGWIAGFHNRDAALLFNSGYDANLGLMSCLPQRGDVVVCDELVHNSVRMGCRLGRQHQTLLFRHNDISHLESTLRGLRPHGTTIGPTRNVFVAVESVYSMDGDLAPLVEILRVAEMHAAMVIVDEAHGTGVFGAQGRGLVSALGLERHPALLTSMHSFGKALGVHGAVVVGSRTLREFLVNYARPLIYSTSLPLHSLACIKCAYRMQAGADDRRARVFNLANKFQSALTERDSANASTTPPLASGEVPHCCSPIQSVVVVGNERSLAVAESLRYLGFDVRAIRQPTVAAGTERLRITLHAYNTVAEVESLARHIRRLAASIAQTGNGDNPPTAMRRPRAGSGLGAPRSRL